MLTRKKTTRSSSTRVEASVATSPVSASSRESAVVAAMEAHGVRLPGSTAVRKDGSSPSRAMP
ncbi:hypothetical protein SALBM135S_09838 [Streptomyces alboniger]